MKIVLIIIAVAIVVLLLLFAVCAVVLNQLISLKTIRIPKIFYSLVAGNDGPNQYEEENKRAVKHFETLPLEELELHSESGTLRAKLLVPEKSNGILVIACHGARSSGLGEFAFEADYFYNGGFTVLMPEHRGCGISDGKFMGYGTHESRDTMLWLDYAEKRFPELSIFLLGVSMGAATVLMMSDKIPENSVKGIIADCSYTSAWDEFKYQLKVSFHLGTFPILYICDLLCRIYAHYSFKDASPVQCVKNAKVPVLFIHGTDDDFVPFYMEKELYSACTSKKKMVAVEGAVHARSYFKNSALYEKELNDFFSENSEKILMSE